MPSAPKLASKLAKVKIVYPRITSPTYSSFLKSAATLRPGNGDALVLVGRVAVDAEYREQLQQKFGHDDKLCRRCIEEMNSKAATSIWQGIKTRSTKRQPGATEAAVLAEGVERFKLPPVGQNHKAQSGKGSKNERWSLQTYDDFATKAERSNPDVTFTKRLMDDTFQRAILVATRYGRGSNKSGVSTSEIDKVLARCLGDESQEYWKDREEGM